MLLMHSLMLYISALPNLTPCGFRVPSLWGNAGYNGNQHWGGWEDACREGACREGGEAGAGRTHAGRTHAGRTHAGRGERQDSLEGKAFKKNPPQNS